MWIKARVKVLIVNYTGIRVFLGVNFFWGYIDILSLIYVIYFSLFSIVLGATGRRRATRVSYVSMINGEESSSLLTRLKIQEDLEERERRRIREKEKKEANLVLLQDLAEWEEKELDPDMIKQLHSMWEVIVVNLKE